MLVVTPRKASEVLHLPCPMTARPYRGTGRRLSTPTEDTAPWEVGFPPSPQFQLTDPEPVGCEIFFLFNYCIFTIYSRYMKRVISKRDGCEYLKQVPFIDGSLELIQ
jgi:hypothetical protein